jgi:hypothetical protein
MVQLNQVAKAVKSAIHNKEKEVEQPQALPDSHQKMALAVHQVFSQGQGVPISSTVAEQMVEMKLWLAAIANGQLKIIDTNLPQVDQPPVDPPPPGNNGDGAETPKD